MEQFSVSPNEGLTTWELLAQAPKFKGLRIRSSGVQGAGKDGCLRSKREWKSNLPLSFCSIQAFNEQDAVYPHCGRQTFTQSAEPSGNFCQRCPHRHSHKSCFRSSLGIP